MPGLWGSNVNRMHFQPPELIFSCVPGRHRSLQQMMTWIGHTGNKQFVGTLGIVCDRPVLPKKGDLTPGGQALNDRGNVLELDLRSLLRVVLGSRGVCFPGPLSLLPRGPLPLLLSSVPVQLRPWALPLHLSWCLPPGPWPCNIQAIGQWQHPFKSRVLG